MKNIVEVKNVYKQYGDYVALNGVSLQVPKGSIYGLLGPNGAGKTSLIRIINQITMPDSGEVILDGEPLQPKHVQQIGYLPEERGLYKTMKVGEQCLYLAQMKGLSKAEAKVQLEYWFDRLEIRGWWDKKIQELSKGMAQKIQFVVCVLHQPKLLIFDEPFSGFDPVNANLIFVHPVFYGCRNDQHPFVLFAHHTVFDDSQIGVGQIYIAVLFVVFKIGGK